MMDDPLTAFLEETQAKSSSTAAATAPVAAAVRYTEVASRIGADLFTESVSFVDPLGGFGGAKGGTSAAATAAPPSPSPMPPPLRRHDSWDLPITSPLRVHSVGDLSPSVTPDASGNSSSIIRSSRSSSGRSSNDIAAAFDRPGLVPVRDGGGTATVSTVTDDDDDARGYEFKYLTGEQKLMSIGDARIQLAPGRHVNCVLLMTSYRLVFAVAPAHLAAIAVGNPSIHSYLQLPLGCIDRIEREKKGKDAVAAAAGRSSSVTLVITCKDVRVLRVTLITNDGTGGNGGMSEHELEKALRLLITSTFPNNRTYMFAFSHSLPSEPLSLSLVEPYDTIQEFSRMGILNVVSVRDDSPMWRASTVNNEYRMCNTYPRVLVVPHKITDDELVLVSNFRSGHRLPVMCWGDRDTGATMWRSSQPKAGVSGSCIQDEKLLELIAQSCVYKRTPTGHIKTIGDPLLHIIDCRPKASALANRATGAGYESQTSYPHTRIEFCNIGNIHTMRDSFRSLTSILLSPIPAGNDVDFSRQIEATQWLTHLRLVLKCGWDTAQMLRKGVPVLVHCSHGWDRTAQVCALAQMFLDPYYRTFDGFKVLVEKEWCSFGHQFPMRCAHGQDRSARQDDQVSPIFLQFLDCVWQVCKQHPHYFEFNARYLLAVADHIYSGRFGTFMFGSDQERDTNDSRHCCVDLWTYLHYNRAALTNPLYMDPDHEHTPTAHTLLPPLTQLLRNVTLWADYYFRWSALPSHVTAPEPLNRFLHEGGLALPLNAVGPDCADMELLAAVTSDDFWEATFRGAVVKEAAASVAAAAASSTVERLVQLLRKNGASESEIATALAGSRHEKDDEEVKTDECTATYEAINGGREAPMQVRAADVAVTSGAAAGTGAACDAMKTPEKARPANGGSGFSTNTNDLLSELVADDQGHLFGGTASPERSPSAHYY